MWLPTSENSRTTQVPSYFGSHPWAWRVSKWATEWRVLLLAVSVQLKRSYIVCGLKYIGNLTPQLPSSQISGRGLPEEVLYRCVRIHQVNWQLCEFLDPYTGQGHRLSSLYTSLFWRKNTRNMFRQVVLAISKIVERRRQGGRTVGPG